MTPLLTRLKSSNADTLEIDGRIYRVTKLTSEVHLREHREEKRVKSVERRVRSKKDLSPEQRQKLNLADKLSKMPESVRRRKLRSLIFERKKLALKEHLNLGCLRQSHLTQIVISPEEIDTEEQIYGAVLLWFEREVKNAE